MFRCSPIHNKGFIEQIARKVMVDTVGKQVKSSETLKRVAQATASVQHGGGKQVVSIISESMTVMRKDLSSAFGMTKDVEVEVKDPKKFPRK